MPLLIKAVGKTAFYPLAKHAHRYLVLSRFKPGTASAGANPKNSHRDREPRAVLADAAPGIEALGLFSLPVKSMRK